MGRGRSGAGKSGGGGGNASTPKAKTPSGIDYDSFMKMSDSEKYDTIDRILADQSIKTPDYLDDSDTSRLMYALGMTNKPQVVSDSQLDSMPGKDLYRTVYETGSMPPPSSADVLDQIRTGDFTRLSGSGGSVHGRALYFAKDDFVGSRVYGDGERNSMMMRAKLDPKAKIMSESKLNRLMNSDAEYNKNWGRKNSGYDAIALYALSHGIDGWYSGTYTMMVNRGVMIMSSQNKHTTKKKGGSYANSAQSWNEAANV